MPLTINKTLFTNAQFTMMGANIRTQCINIECLQNGWQRQTLNLPYGVRCGYCGTPGLIQCASCKKFGPMPEGFNHEQLRKVREGGFEAPIVFRCPMYCFAPLCQSCFDTHDCEELDWTWTVDYSWRLRPEAEWPVWDDTWNHHGWAMHFPRVQFYVLSEPAECRICHGTIDAGSIDVAAYMHTKGSISVAHSRCLEPFRESGLIFFGIIHEHLMPLRECSVGKLPGTVPYSRFTQQPV